MSREAHVRFCESLAGWFRRATRPAMESFFKTLKVERIHQLRYDTRALAKLDIVDWIEGFYNQRRMHSSIGYKTPVDVESNLMTA